MKQYLDLLSHIRQNGVYKADRTGTGTYSVFGHQMRFDLSKGFPLVTTKQCHLKSIIHELLWFLKGDTNVKYLKENGVSIWDEWVKEGTAEYLELSIRERSELVAKKGAEALDKWTDHIIAVRGPADNLRPLTDDVIEQHHQFLDSLEIQRRVLVDGELGPVYGYQWRSWPSIKLINNECVDLSKDVWDEVYHAENETTYAIIKESIDQITNLIKMLTNNPDSRRLIVSAWNPALVDEMALPPCHALFQFYSNQLTMRELDDMIREAGAEMSGRYLRGTEGITFETTDDYYNYALKFCSENGLPTRKLSCQLYQRSADVFLGVPFNIASYSLLVLMVAQVTNMVPGEFIWTGGDCHIYSNHLEQVDLQLSRKPFPLPTMEINPTVKDIFGFTFEDFELTGYTAHPHIKAQVAV